MSPLNITQPLGIWSIMATVRWCPIFPKWDSCQPLLKPFFQRKMAKSSPHFILQTPHLMIQTSHVTLHTSHSHRNTSHITPSTPHFTLHTPKLPRSHFTLHTLISTLPTSHTSLHTSHSTKLCLLICTGPNFGPRCVLNKVCWYAWVQLRPWVCFDRYLLKCAGSNFVPRCVVNGVCWHVLGPKLALDVFWTLSADMYWVQLWP